VNLSHAFNAVRFGNSIDYSCVEHFSMLERTRIKRRYPALFVYYPKAIFMCQVCGKYYRPKHYGFCTAGKDTFMFVLSTELVSVKSPSMIGDCAPICNHCVDITDTNKYGFSYIAMTAQYTVNDKITEFVGTSVVHTDFDFVKVKDICDKNIFKRESVFGEPVHIEKTPLDRSEFERIKTMTFDSVVTKYWFKRYVPLIKGGQTEREIDCGF